MLGVVIVMTVILIVLYKKRYYKVCVVRGVVEYIVSSAFLALNSIILPTTYAGYYGLACAIIIDATYTFLVHLRT